MPMPQPLAEIGRGPFWDTWPFTPGYGDFWSTALKFLLVAIILGAILLFLRFLYGPKGVFRDHEMDREAEEMRRKELEEIERAHSAGELSDLEYLYRKKRLRP